MPRITSLGTGLIYRNPTPHVHSVHTYFPSVVSMDNGEMLATLVLGEAFESSNCRTWAARSTDAGASWTLEQMLYPGTTDRLTSDSSRLTALPGGELAVFMVRADRTDHPHEGLTNPETLGFVPCDLLLVRSKDYGRTWEPPAIMQPPLVGPSFELCSPITPLSDGRWLLPTSTWPGWNGDCPNGLRMVGFISSDKGATWPTYTTVMHETDVFFWESKIVELPDGRLLAVAWTYDNAAGKDRPNHYTISHDGGKSWSAPTSMGLKGQTLTPHVLPDGRLLFIYRRIDEPGLWAVLSHLEGDQLVNDQWEPLWGARTAGLTGSSSNMTQNFGVLRFGAPCITTAPDGTLFVAFWCYEDCVSNVRWIRLQID